MAKKYIVDLTSEEKDELIQLTQKGKISARLLKRANILLLANEGITDSEIAEILHVNPSTVERTRQKFVSGNLQNALNEQPRKGRPVELDGKAEAFLIATACSNPPDGHKCWTIRLLASHLVELGVISSISRETVRLRLKKNETKPWQKKQWCIPKLDPEFIWRMEDILELYQMPYDPLRPLVCFDETPYQLIGETRLPLPPQPGQCQRFDYEYRRHGTRNLFVFFQPHLGWRYVSITLQRTKIDFAHAMKDLVDIHFPQAQKIVVVLDNLNTHTPASLYEAFSPEEARRLLRKLEFHYTPKHASWLNMVEIEISVLMTQCLDRRIGCPEKLRYEIAAWQRKRNMEKATVSWRFTTVDAREKLKQLYSA